MGAALSIFVLLSISIFVMRIAAVALRFTGMPESIARFQALSAFTGTGFTTSEAEMVVNYPLRRRIVSAMMVIGNLGLVSVLATLVSSLVRTEGDVDAVALQLAWLMAGLVLLWILVLNKRADRLLCSLIGKVLAATNVLGRRKFHRLLQVSDGYSVCEHPVPSYLHGKSRDRLAEELQELELKLLAVRSAKEGIRSADSPDEPIHEDQQLVLFGPDFGHETLGDDKRREQP
jgi:hypothetical protein